MKASLQRLSIGLVWKLSMSGDALRYHNIAPVVGAISAVRTHITCKERDGLDITGSEDADVGSIYISYQGNDIAIRDTGILHRNFITDFHFIQVIKNICAAVSCHRMTGKDDISVFTKPAHVFQMSYIHGKMRDIPCLQFV